MAIIQYCGMSETGLVRQENQDCFLINGIIERFAVGVTTSDSGLFFDTYGTLCAVADGMGGHAGGALASRLALEVLATEMYMLTGAKDEFAATGQLNRMITRAHEILVEQGGTNSDLEGMGTTLVGLYARPEVALSFHAGDSRMYRFRGGSLLQVTSDHSVENIRGSVTGDVKAGPKSGRITNSLGGGPRATCTPEITPVSFRDGDTMLLCSDGLSDMVEFKYIESVLGQAEPLNVKATRLISAAVEAGGKDNITVLLITRGGMV